jgi:hypothetical protein
MTSSPQGRPSPIHPTSIHKAGTRSVDVSDLASFDPKEVTVRCSDIVSRAIEPGEAHEDVHDTHLFIDHVSPVDQRNVLRKAANVARICGEVSASGVCAAFETRAGRAKRDLDCDVVEAVRVGVACTFDHLARLAWDRVPIFLTVPVFVACRIECPITLVGDDAVNEVDVAFFVERHLSVNDIGVLGVGDDNLRERLALRCVVHRAIEVHVHAKGWCTVQEVRSLVVLHVLTAVRHIFELIVLSCGHQIDVLGSHAL